MNGERPAKPGPDGLYTHYVVQPAAGYFVIYEGQMRCGSGDPACGAPAVAKQDRGGLWLETPRWRGYCAEHLLSKWGCWIEDGQVVQWVKVSKPRDEWSEEATRRLMEGENL